MKKETIALLAAVIISAEQIAAAKEKHGDGNVRILSLPLEDGGEDSLDILVRVPGRKEIGDFEKWMNTQPDKAKEILINSCVLTCKDEVKGDTGLFFTAVNGIAELFPIRKAVVKNC